MFVNLQLDASQIEYLKCVMPMLQDYALKIAGNNPLFALNVSVNAFLFMDLLMLSCSEVWCLLF